MNEYTFLAQLFCLTHFYYFFLPDAQPLAGYHGYHQAVVSAQPHLRQKSRMRTVFTDSQTKRLETLFELTDYPAAEARAEVARSTGLSEETVRVSPSSGFLACVKPTHVA